MDSLKAHTYNMPLDLCPFTVLFLLSWCVTRFVQGASLAPHEEVSPKLLIVSYDAFRHDYFERNLTPFMNKIRKEGAYADHMNNIFVTKTFPNHHTIATGVYAETHGVIDNSFYDYKLNKSFSLGPDLYSYGNSLPIWAVNEKQGKRSGSMMWPGSVYTYQNITPTFMQKHNESVPHEERIDKMISWLLDEKNPIDLGLLYFEDPDLHGHVFGINDPQFNEILKKMDNITKYLHRKLEDAELLGKINVVHLSDHGMMNVRYDHIINITKYIDPSDYVRGGAAPNLQVYPKPGKEEKIYNALKTAAEETKSFDVYKKKDIPDRFHYKNNPRVGDIFVAAKPGYTFESLYKDIEWYKTKFNITVTNSTEFGVHGYDNQLPEMQPMFFAYGPAFKSNCRFKIFSNIDLYPLFCNVLHLECPPNDGSLNKLSDCLITEEKRSFNSLALYIAIIVAVIICGIGTIMYKRHRDAKAAYRKIFDIREVEHYWDETEEENFP